MKTFASEDVPMSTCPFSMKLVTQLVPLVTLSIVVYMYTHLPMQLDTLNDINFHLSFE